MHVISIDDFFLDRGYLIERARKRGETPDFDSPDTIDFDALAETVDAIERNVPKLANISAMFDRGLDNKAIADVALEGVEFDVFDELYVDYKCNCSRERVQKALITLGARDLYDMLREQREEGKPDELEVACRFCGRKEIFTHAEIDKMVENM